MMQNPLLIRLRLGLLPLLLLLATSLSSCKDETVAPPAPPVDYRGTIVRSTLLQTWSKTQVDSMLSANGIGAFIQASYGVKIYRVVYNTPSYDNTQTYTSGLVCLPDDTTKTYPLTSYQHGTVVEKNKTPSFINNSEAYLNIGLASTGYVAVATDYLGMGEGPGFHPYQHGNSQATAAIDLIRAARTLAGQQGVKLSGKVFLFGYSQGGHATMATQKMIQERHSSEFNVVASAPMAGAYDLDGAQADVILSDSTYPAPYYLPYILLSYNMVYKVKASNAEIFKEPYLSTVVPLFNGVASAGQIDDNMPNVPKLIVIDTVLANFASQQNHAFRVALRENDLTNWVPNVPTRIYYGNKDSHVSPQNSINCYNSMMALGATQVQLIDIGPYDHSEAAPFCMLSAKQWFDSLK